VVDPAAVDSAVAVEWADPPVVAECQGAWVVLVAAVQP